MKTATECYQCKKEVDIIGSDEGIHYYAEKDGREHVCETLAYPKCQKCQARVIEVGKHLGMRCYVEQDGRVHVCKADPTTHCPRCEHYAIVVELEFGDDNYFCYGCNWRWRA